MADNLGFMFGGGGSGLQDLKWKIEAAQADANGDNPYLKPKYPTYLGMEPDALSLLGMAEERLGGINPDRTALNKYNAEANRTGLSKGAEQAMTAARYLAARGRDDGKAQAAGEAAQASTALATRGGLRSGAAERLAGSMGNRSLDLAQTGRDTAARNQMNIGMEDEKNRIGMLGNAVGMNQNAAQFDLGKNQAIMGVASDDVNRRQMENTKLNTFNMSKYQADMGAWAANKQADATANSGKK